MEDFLLLGQIPGTQIFITFQMWLIVCNAIICYILCWLLITRRKQIEMFTLKLRAGIYKRDELLPIDLV